MPTITCVEDPSITYTSPPLPPVIKKKGLWIAFGEKHKYEAQYKDGQLLTSKGKPYEGRGVKVKKDGSVVLQNTYLEAVVKALDKIALAEQEIGTDVIKTLQESRFKYTIANDMNRFSVNQFGERSNTWMNNACANQIKLQNGKLIVEGAPFDDVGAGGLIYWKSLKEGTIETRKGEKKGNIMMSLAHEIYHAYDANFGDLDRRNIKNIKDETIYITEHCEGRAVFYVNQLRTSLVFNIKYLRMMYIKNDCKLLNNKGEPIYFESPSELLKAKK